MSVDSSLHYTCNPFAYHDIPTSTFSPQLCLYSTLNRIKELLIDLYSLDSGRLTNRIVSNKTSINYTLLITDHCLKKTNSTNRILLLNIQISNYFPLKLFIYNELYYNYCHIIFFNYYHNSHSNKSKWSNLH